MLKYCPYYKKSQSIVVVQARWSVDFGLDNSVVEYLTNDAGVLGSTPSPTILFLFVFLSIFYLCSLNVFITTIPIINFQHIIINLH